MQSKREKLFEYFLAADKLGAIKFIEDFAESSSYENAFTEIVEPSLQKFGERWASNEDVNLAQGFISAKITEEIMNRLAKERSGNQTAIKKRGIAVIGNIEDDYHSLGRKMVGNFLAAGGWSVFDLGNDVLAADFVNKAEEVDADVIGASAMMYSNAKNMAKIRMELDSRGLNGKIKFAVGGAVFNIRPELVEELGADGTAKNALEAVDLFNSLKQKSIYDEQLRSNK